MATKKKLPGIMAKLPTKEEVTAAAKVEVPGIPGTVTAEPAATEEPKVATEPAAKKTRVKKAKAEKPADEVAAEEKAAGKKKPADPDNRRITVMLHKDVVILIRTYGVLHKKTDGEAITELLAPHMKKNQPPAAQSEGGQAPE